MTARNQILAQMKQLIQVYLLYLTYRHIILKPLEIPYRLFWMELYFLERTILPAQPWEFWLVKIHSPVFDYVEIDSSFYRIPNQFMVKNWVKRTPDNFRFTAKFPKMITHDKYLVDVEEEVELFLDNIEPLGDKALALLIQLPPSMEIMQGLEGLRNLLPLLDDRFRYAVEVRHHSWFQDLAYNFFADNDICLVWSQLAKLRTPPIVTTDFLYVRFIGDRSIDEKDFGKIQKDRVLETSNWAEQIRNVEGGKEKGRRSEVRDAMIAANTMRVLDQEL